MTSKDTLDAWLAIAETSKLLARIEEKPPQERIGVARKYLLKNCLILRRMFSRDDSDSQEVLKDAQRTLLHLRKLRETGSATTH